MPTQGIRTVRIKRGENGDCEHVRLVFGPHYFVELHRESNGNVTFALGATHHGFRADASDVDGESEQIINEIRRAHPTNLVD